MQGLKINNIINLIKYLYDHFVGLYIMCVHASLVWNTHAKKYLMSLKCLKIMCYMTKSQIFNEKSNLSILKYYYIPILILKLMTFNAVVSHVLNYFIILPFIIIIL